MNFSSFKHSYLKADKKLGVINESALDDNTMEVNQLFDHVGVFPRTEACRRPNVTQT